MACAGSPTLTRLAAACELALTRQVPIELDKLDCISLIYTSMEK